MLCGQLKQKATQNTSKKDSAKLTDLSSPGQSARFPGPLEEDVDREGQDVAHEGKGL